jgi:hypothetical protein
MLFKKKKSDLYPVLCAPTNYNNNKNEELVDPVNAYIFLKRLNILGTK